MAEAVAGARAGGGERKAAAAKDTDASFMEAAVAAAEAEAERKSQESAAAPVASAGHASVALAASLAARRVKRPKKPRTAPPRAGQLCFVRCRGLRVHLDDDAGEVLPHDAHIRVWWNDREIGRSKETPIREGKALWHGRRESRALVPLNVPLTDFMNEDNMLRAEVYAQARLSVSADGSRIQHGPPRFLGQVVLRGEGLGGLPTVEVEFPLTGISVRDLGLNDTIQRNIANKFKLPALNAYVSGRLCLRYHEAKKELVEQPLKNIQLEPQEVLSLPHVSSVIDLANACHGAGTLQQLVAHAERRPGIERWDNSQALLTIFENSSNGKHAKTKRGAESECMEFDVTLLSRRFSGTLGIKAVKVGTVSHTRGRADVVTVRGVDGMRVAEGCEVPRVGDEVVEIMGIVVDGQDDSRLAFALRAVKKKLMTGTTQARAAPPPRHPALPSFRGTCSSVSQVSEACVPRANLASAVHAVCGARLFTPHSLFCLRLCCVE